MPVKQILGHLNESMEEMDRTRWGFATLALIAAVYWHLAWRMIDGVAYTISAALAAFSLLLVLAGWTWLDHRQGKTTIGDYSKDTREWIFGILGMVVGGFVLWALLLA